MTYHMQKQERQITDESTLKNIIKRGKYTAIALCKDNEPYIVTLSYGYDEVKNALYFHTALSGLKLHILRQNPRVCATVVDDLGYIDGKCAHAYRSVVLLGKMHVVDDLAEKKHGFEVLFRHLNEDTERYKQRGLKDDAGYDRAAVLRLDIEAVTGKAGR